MALQSGIVRCLSKSFTAEEDITQYHAVKFGSADNGILQTDTQGEKALGIALEDADSGQAVEVLILGICPVIVSAYSGTGVGDNITPSAEGSPSVDAGKVEEAASGDYIMGRILDAAAADDDQVMAIINCTKFDCALA